MSEYLYYRPDYGETPEGANSLFSKWAYDLESAAKEVCEHNFHDTWDYSVPDILLIKEAGAEDWHKVALEVAPVPEFSARLVAI